MLQVVRRKQWWENVTEYTCGRKLLERRGNMSKEGQGNSSESDKNFGSKLVA